MYSESLRIRKRYAARKEKDSQLYSPFRADVFMSQQEKEREIIKLFRKLNLTNLSDKKLLEIGCGYGANLTRLMRLGFKPCNVYANELLEDRLQAAAEYLPKEVKIIPGDACLIENYDNFFDVVLQSTVFTSILDREYQNLLAKKLWSIVKPGGLVLWYDFCFNNPNNKDVRGVKPKRIQELFPEGTIISKKVTLAPPISRMVTKVHESFYTLFNFFPFLRTHILCAIIKS